MDWNEYVTKSAETAVYPKQITDPSGLAYPVLKLTGEVGEFVIALHKFVSSKNDTFTPYPQVKKYEEAMKKEAGDVLWYIAALERSIDIKAKPCKRNVKIDEYQTITLLTEYLYDSTAKLAEMTGKLFRDKQGEIDEESEFLRFFQEHCMTITYAIAQLLYTYDISVGEVLKMNVVKLQSRKKRSVLQGSGDDR